MKTQFEQMMDGLNDVEAFLAGEQEGFKAYVPQEVDVKAIRNRLNPAAFAAAVGSSKPTTVHVSRHRKRQASRGVTRRNAQSAGRKRIAK